MEVVKVCEQVLVANDFAPYPDAPYPDAQVGIKQET